jgi:hypothetical protein
MIWDPVIKGEKIAKTYNSGDSPVVTHLTTSPPVRCLNRAERTGSLAITCSATTACLQYCATRKPVLEGVS